jgi:error-prone DNA polymerase
MKLRAPKGKGAICEEELGTYARGLVCLTGGEHGPLTKCHPEQNRFSNAGSSHPHLGQENIYVELRATSIATKKRSTSRAMALAARFGLPLLATNGVCYAAKQEAGDSRCLHMYPQSSNTGDRRPAPRQEFRPLCQNT